MWGGGGKGLHECVCVCVSAHTRKGKELHECVCIKMHIRFSIQKSLLSCICEIFEKMIAASAYLFMLDLE